MTDPYVGALAVELRAQASEVGFPAIVARLTAEALEETGSPETRAVRNRNAYLFQRLLAGDDAEEIVCAIVAVREAVACWRKAHDARPER